MAEDNDQEEERRAGPPSEERVRLEPVLFADLVQRLENENRLVEAVTDDGSLPKAERKRAQLDAAADLSTDAKWIRIADKICNARDVGFAPAAGWPLDRRRAYLDWTEQVVDRCRGHLYPLERRYDDVLAESRAQLAAEEQGGA